MAVERNMVKDLIAAQRACEKLSKDAVNPHFKSKYATLDSVRDAVKEAFWSNGFAITQEGIVREDGLPLMRTALRHVSGQMVASDVPLIATDNPQKLGGAITYARRYGLQCVAFVVAEEDDDGNAASAPAGSKKPAASDKMDSFLKKIYGALTENFGEGEPWKGDKRRVLELAFGKVKKADIVALGEEKVFEILKTKFVACIEQAKAEVAHQHQEGATDPAPEAPASEDLPF